MRGSKFQKGQLILLVVVIAVGVGSMLLDVSGMGNDPAETAPLVVGQQVEAAQAGAYACAFEDTAHNTVALVQQGNQHKFETFFESNECREIGADLRLNVVAVRNGYSQVKGEDKFFARGVWVPPGMLRAVKPV